ncbi:TldD/PmbA family protein [Candidatus Bipolaricaulota bacterium]|nr:TldD/PmbA family protein [Candidatus Bipolaricaulota bacterium]
MHPLLERTRDRVDQADVYHLQRKVLPVVFDPEGLSVIKTKQTEGVALRVLCEGRLGYSTSTDLARPEAVVEAAVATAAYGDVTDLTFPDTAIERLVGLHDSQATPPSAEQLVAIGAAIQKRLLADGSNLEVGVSVEMMTDHIRIANSNGLDTEETRSSIEIGIEATRAQSGDIFTVADSHHVRALGDVCIEDLTQRIRRLLEWGRDVVSAPSGSLPVVFTPSGTLALLLPLMMGLNGKSVLLKLSPLTEKLGQGLFDSRLNLVDDGRCVRGASAGSFDDEGVPTQTTSLIDEGQLSGFYYDLRTAQQAGVASTGNGYKGGLIGASSFRPSPSSTISSLVVGAGDASEAELIRGIKKGLLVDGVLGLGQGNLNAGDFSNNVAAAFAIENGRIVGRVKNVMLAGNCYELLRDQLIGLGDTAEWVYGKLLCPAIAVDHVNVAAK